MKRKLVLFIVMCFVGMAFGQEDKVESQLIDYQRGLGIESFYQLNYGLALGGLISKNIGNKVKPNFSAGIYVDAIFEKELVYGPRLKLIMNHAGIFGFTIDFASYFREGLNDFSITPGVNFSLYGIASLFIGYSYFRTENIFNNTDQFRVGLNFSLVDKKYHTE